MQQNNPLILALGALPSKHDYRTVQASDLVTGTMPPVSFKVDLNHPCTDDLCNQRNLGICTKCACRMAQEHYANDGTRLSEYWGYLIGKVFVDQNLYEGSSALTMLKAAKKYGTPSKMMEAQFPLNVGGSYAEFIADFNARYGGWIPNEIMTDAANHKIGGYYQVAVDPVSLAKEISAGRVVIIRLAVGESFWTAENGEVTWDAKKLLPIRAPINVVSGHLLAMNEYNGLSHDQLDKGPNSWSKAWADNGYYSFIFNVQAPYYFTEAWAIVDLPPAVINLVLDLPEAKNFTHVFNKFIDRGQTGDEVRALQIALSILGFLNIQVDELGTYGPKTATAVLAYQKARKLLPDAQLDANKGNYVHKLTIDSLNKDLKK